MTIELKEEEIRYIISALRNQIITYSEETVNAYRKNENRLVETLIEYIINYQELTKKLQDEYEKTCKEIGELPF